MTIRRTPVRLPSRRSKYRAKPCVVHGFRFASQAEARHYGELLKLGSIGVLKNLELQPRFPLVVNGVQIGTYVGDFRYQIEELIWGEGKDHGRCWSNWHDVVCDVKGFKTEAYKIKKKLVEALYGVSILEVKA